MYFHIQLEKNIFIVIVLVVFYVCFDSYELNIIHLSDSAVASLISYTRVTHIDVSHSRQAC